MRNSKTSGEIGANESLQERAKIFACSCKLSFAPILALVLLRIALTISPWVSQDEEKGDQGA